MILWFGVENDNKRHIKIDWYKGKLNDHNTEKSLEKLQPGDLAYKPTTRWFGRKPKEKLIISGHGNHQALMGLTAETLFDKLVSKGLNSDRFDSIYLLGCDIGLAKQDNSVQQNFLKTFGVSC